MLTKKSIFCLVLSLAFPFYLKSQSFDYFETKFKAAKKNYDEQNFSLSASEFKNLMQIHQNNTYAIYAAFYYGLSTFEIKQFADSKVTFTKLIETYPKWTQLEDVQYWLALSQFELGFPADAVKILTILEKNQSFFTMSQLAKKTYLPLCNQEQLRFFYLGYPNDKAIAEALADKVASMPEAMRDSKLLLEIKVKFGYSPEMKTEKPIEENKQNNVISGKSVKKTAYNIAALLPISLDDFDVSNTHRKNQYLVDLYVGMKIAAEKLNESGKKINLCFFDTEKDALKVKEILSGSDVQNIDLVLGPVTATGFNTATGLLSKSPISIVHPFTAYGELVSGKNNAFLFESSYIAQSQTAANMMIDSLNRKNAYIIYGETRSDSVLAHNYKQQIEKKGGKVILFAHYPNLSGAYKKLKTQLAAITPEPPRLTEKDKKELTPSEIAEKTKTKEDIDAHIAVFTTQQALAINISSIVRSSLIDIPMVVNKEWLNFEQVGFETFNDKRIFILHPSMVNRESPYFMPFIKDYTSITKMYPSEYAFIGFECLSFFGNALIEHGQNFKDNLKTQKVNKGFLMYERDYTKANYNSIVPILQIKGGIPTLIFRK